MKTTIKAFLIQIFSTRNRFRFLILALLTLNIIFLIKIVDLKLKYEISNYNSGGFLINNLNGVPADFEFPWPENKKIALSLAFDDARVSQIDSGIPLLDKYAVRATFYVLTNNVKQRIDGWRKAIKSGHDIGNHTSLHPCSQDYDWGHRNSLENYTLPRMQNDLENENIVLGELLGISPVSFAYPCGQTFVGEGVNTKSYVPLVAKLFETGRLYSGGTVNPLFCDFAKLPSENLDNRTFEQIIELINTAKKNKKWLILTGHDIGYSTKIQTSSLKTLDEICKYAADPANEIWIDNVQNVSNYIKNIRKEKKFKYISEYRNPYSSFKSKVWYLWYLTKTKYTLFIEKFKGAKETNS